MSGEGIALADGGEQDLASRLARSDSAAFEQLVALHAPRIRRLAFRLLGWRGDVDDVVQDVFLAALCHLERFRGEASLSTWLTRVTINRCRTQHRRHLLRLRWLAQRTRPAAAQAADVQAARDETSARVRLAVQNLR